MKTLADVSIDSIQRAREVIQSTIVRTPIQKVHGLCRPGKDLFIKLENQQLTGSFKIRGAMNRMSSLSDEQRAKGVIASSAGNHAQGVAYSAKKLGVSCTIVMPALSRYALFASRYYYSTHPELLEIDLLNSELVH